MNNQEMNPNNTEEKSPDLKLIKLQRIGLAVILAATLSGIGGCEFNNNIDKQTIPTTSTQEEIIYDNYIDNGSGPEFIEGSMDNTQTTPGSSDISVSPKP